jgi:hypothetical protein
MWLIQYHRHLDLLQLTFNSNYQSSRFVNNSNELDISTYAGKAYFKTKAKMDKDLNKVVPRYGAVSLPVHSYCFFH